MRWLTIAAKVCTVVVPVISAACLLNSALAQTPRRAVRWVADGPNTNRVRVEVAGLDANALDALRHANFTAVQWQRLLAVRAEQGDLFAEVGMPTMAGNYRLEAGTLCFIPDYPLEPGLSYRAVFYPQAIPGSSGTGSVPVSAVFKMPLLQPVAATVVTRVFPSAGLLPENLLKFYVHFSAPMSRGHIYEHIHLRNERGHDVELPFLEIDEELWDPAMTRLTLFIDPGRIKRGVLPLEEIGPALEEGKSYTLHIDRAWKDATGHALKEDYLHRFKVGPPDREPPDPARWKVQPPVAGGRDRLTVEFGESMDHALAQRLVRVTQAAGEFIAGSAALEDVERRWVFTPSTLWKPGRYHLAVQTTIEDLAGNNIGKPFEVDLFDGVERHLTNAVVKLSFEVR